MATRKYAGIGSRETPSDILATMTAIASALRTDGYILRSGGAVGADTAFARGADSDIELYRPHHSNAAAELLVSNVHPAWHRCGSYVRKLHGRNAMIILGPYLNQPVDFVVCWTKNGIPQGGTRTGIILANQWNIPVRNLGDAAVLKRAQDWLASRGA